LYVGIDHIDLGPLIIGSEAGSESATPLAQAEEGKVGVKLRRERGARFHRA
jgi:hypothetical protein